MQFITSSISTMLVLLLLGLVVFFVLTVNNLSVYVRENIAFSVTVSDDMKEPEILKFQKALNEKPYVKQTTYISKKQALEEQTQAMGTDPTEFLGYNPFTASIDIRLNSEYANSDSIQWIEKELLANKKVLEINYPQDLIDSVNRNLKKISFFFTGTCSTAYLYIVCTDKQHHPADHLFQTLPYPYHEAGWKPVGRSSDDRFWYVTFG